MVHLINLNPNKGQLALKKVKMSKNKNWNKELMKLK